MRYLCVVFAVIAMPIGSAWAQSPGVNQQIGNSSARANAASGSTAVVSSSPTSSINQTYQSGGTSTIHNTPDVAGPPIYGGTNPCAVGASGGVSVAGLGLAGGGMWNSPGCERRNAAVILFQANLPDVAVALLCQDDGIRTAFKEAGKPCPADRVQVSAVTEPAPVAQASYTPPPAPAPVAAAPAPAPVQVASAPEASDSGLPRARQDWCSKTAAPKHGDHSSDATAYRYYCQ